MNKKNELMIKKIISIGVLIVYFIKTIPIITTKIFIGDIGKRLPQIKHTKKYKSETLNPQFILVLLNKYLVLCCWKFVEFIIYFIFNLTIVYTIKSICQRF